MHFGLVPSFTPKDAKPDFFRMMNARVETVDALPAFRRLLKSNRCIVLVDGFYEWHAEPKGKQPYYIASAGAGEEGGEPPMLWMAGLWDKRVLEDDNSELYSFTILTTDVCPELAWLHDRMPVILNAEAARAWLDVDGTEPAEALRRCRPVCSLQWHKVHPRMGTVKYEGDDAHLPWRPTPITNFFAPSRQHANAGEAAGAGSSPAGRKGAEEQKAAGSHETAARAGSAEVAAADEYGRKSERAPPALQQSEDAPAEDGKRGREGAQAPSSPGGTADSKRLKVVESDGGTPAHVQPTPSPHARGKPPAPAPSSTKQHAKSASASKKSPASKQRSIATFFQRSNPS